MQRQAVSIQARTQRAKSDSSVTPPQPLRRKQHRVTYRRKRWSTATSTKSRSFWTREAALLFLHRLHDTQSLWGPLDFATLESREVLLGRWKESAR